MTEDEFATAMRRWAVWRALKDELAQMHPRAVVQDYENGPICSRPDYLSDPERRVQRSMDHERSDPESKALDEIITELGLYNSRRLEVIRARYLTSPGEVIGDPNVADLLGLSRSMVAEIRGRSEGWIESRFHQLHHQGSEKIKKAS